MYGEKGVAKVVCVLSISNDGVLIPELVGDRSIEVEFGDAVVADRDDAIDASLARGPILDGGPRFVTSNAREFTRAAR